MGEKEPSKRHPLKGFQDKKLEAHDEGTFTRGEIQKARGTQIEGTPLAQSRFDRMMEESDREMEAWRGVIRKHGKTPLPNPKE